MPPVSAIIALAAGGWWSWAPPSTSTEISWAPAEPVQGSIILFSVRPVREPSPPGAVLIVRGEFAGQPLHFEFTSAAVFSAIGAVPVSATDSLPLTLTLVNQDGSERQVTLAVAISKARFPMERLRVASRFTRPPDAALSRRIARERSRSRAVWQRSPDTPRLWNAAFLRPRSSRITSPFGSGRVFNGRLQSRHMGTDFDGDDGDPVRAANRGLVALVGNFYYSGRIVYIDHGRGLLTAYLHLSQVNVSEGDVVERGQVIGAVGSTGRVTGPHLHWIARVGAVIVNPMSLLELPVHGFADVTPADPAR